MTTSKNALMFRAQDTKVNSDEWYCSATPAKMLQAYGYKVFFAGYGEITDTLKNHNIHLYVMPGSNKDVNKLFKKFTQNDIAGVVDFISLGGTYLGLCAGAFLATNLGFNLLKTIPYWNEKKGYKHEIMAPV